MDTSDADLGSVNPVDVDLPGATPQKMILQISKDGHLYILDATALGGSAAPKSTSRVAASGMSIHRTPTANKTAMGQYLVINTTNGANMCPGGVSGRALVALKILGCEPACGDGRLVLGYRGQRVDRADRDDDGRHCQCHGVVHQQRQHSQSPRRRHRRADFNGTGSTCASVQRWTSPIALNNKIVVGGNGHLCSWSLP